MSNVQETANTNTQETPAYWAEIYEKAQAFMQSIDRQGMSLEGGVFVCKDQKLNLRTKKNALELISILFDEDNKPVEKSSLLSKMFGETSGFSIQLSRAIEQNLVKRISRTRLLLIKAFGGTVYDWLPYQHDTQSWSLFKVK